MKNNTIKELNQLLCDAKVFFQNLHNFHWNITGQFFIELHGKLGCLYDAVGDNTDVFAERILALGGTPISRYSEYLKMSGIKEYPVTSSDSAIITAVIDCLNKTVGQLNKTRKAAVAEDDEGTNTLMGDKLLAVEKELWQWNALRKKKSGLDKFFEQKQ